MGLRDFVREEGVTACDYNSYDEDLAKEIDDRIENNEWLSNPKQPYYVVEVVERALSKLQTQKQYNSNLIRNCRKEAQDELHSEMDVRKQTVQNACQRALFEGHEEPPIDYRGERQWAVLFDSVIQEIVRER